MYSPTATAPPQVGGAVPVAFACPTTSASSASFEHGEGISSELVQDDLVELTSVIRCWTCIARPTTFTR